MLAQAHSTFSLHMCVEWLSASLGLIDEVVNCQKKNSLSNEHGGMTQHQINVKHIITSKEMKIWHGYLPETEVHSV